MPDALSKITFFFESNGGTAPTGWTETFYSQNANINQVLADAKSTYVGARAVMLGVGCSLQSIRVSDFVNKRITQVAFVSGGSGQSKTYTDPATDFFDPTQVDLLVRLQTDAGKKRSLALSGLPDKVTDQLVQQGIFDFFTNGPGFKNWLKAITALAYCVRYKVPGSNPAVYLTDVIAGGQAIMVRNRKRGRPFDLFRGRRLA